MYNLEIWFSIAMVSVVICLVNLCIVVFLKIKNKLMHYENENDYNYVESKLNYINNIDTEYLQLNLNETNKKGNFKSKRLKKKYLDDPLKEEKKDVEADEIQFNTVTESTSFISIYNISDKNEINHERNTM